MSFCNWIAIKKKDFFESNRITIEHMKDVQKETKNGFFFKVMSVNAQVKE